ncbi:MAG: hypothetical protein ACQSGP_17265 [Frankia sp.]
MDGTTPLLLAFATAWLARRELSGLIRLYLSSISVSLVIAPRFDFSAVITRDERSRLGTYTALWVVTSVIAGLLTSRRRNQPRPRAERGLSPRSAPVLGPVLASSFLCLLIQAMLIAASAIGMAAQYAGGSSGGGYIGLLGQIGPAIAAGGVLAARAAGQSRSPLGMAAIGLLAAHVVLLTFTGFRGAAPILLLVLPVAASGAPGQPRVRSRLAVAGAFAGAMTALFLFGAAIRTQAASQVTAAGEITNSVGTGNLVTTVVERLDYVPFLRQAVYLRHDAQARSAVRLSDQVRALTPRFLSHRKKPVAYGEQVAVEFFGAPPGAPTASTITALGDGIVNVGTYGALMMIGIYLIALDTAFRYVGSTPSPRNLALLVILAQTAFDIGSPVIMNGIGTLRNILSAIIILAIADRLLPVGIFTAPASPDAPRPHRRLVDSGRPALAPALRVEMTDGQSA